MAIQRFARSALSSASTLTSTSTMTTAATVARVFGASPAALSKQLSTTAFRLAPPRSPPHAGSWPPQRSQSASPSSSSSSSSSPSSTSSPLANDPLKDLYSSDNPAQWAAWSSDDFQQRHSSSSSFSSASSFAATPNAQGLKPGESARLTSNSSRTHPGGGTRITLGPITGRTVHVGGSLDSAQAFLMLSIMVRRNQVHADFQRQRFHERPGKKRKRLASVWWRNKFQRGFVATVERAKTLARQGW
ncbi:hypothetical protein SCUCBS95973_005968 [Sporothrix curviconia]|uniref:Ribosomal protein S21 n=1 Tax=Sporothrix curviconia TaxID=1260050 RepID=A0ABP0C379_9PEZI